MVEAAVTDISELKLCKACEQEKPLDDFYRNRSLGGKERQSTCKSCSKARKREWELANLERKREVQKRYHNKNPKRGAGDSRQHRERHPKKARARRAVEYAVRIGKIIKPEICEDCGEIVSDLRKLHGHHADYSKPLDVEWLCRSCHEKRHF
jgi:hypothetical protein